MTLTNHFMTGVGIALITKNPFIALPMAIVSHYILDSLPHYGFKVWDQRNKGIFKILFRTMLVVDVIVISFFIIFLINNNVPAWYYLSGICGYLPDFAWWYIWAIPEKFGTVRSELNFINRFHSDIQKLERLWGVIPEAVYGITIFVLIKGSLT